MEYQTFISTIKQELEQIYGSTVEVTVDHHFKNNNMEMDSITLRNPDFNIAPTFYLNPYYARHLDGVSIADIVEDIHTTYDKAAPCQNFDVTQYTHFELAKDSICMRLVNFERNKNLLMDLPHIRFHDLAVVFAYVMPTDDDGCASILVHRNHTTLWNVTSEELYQLALMNTPKILPAKLDPISHYLKKMVNFDNIEDLETIYPMLILSNSRMLYGACALLYPGVLDELAQKYDSDLTIIPSSIHEVIILPDGAPDVGTLSEMIQEVNETELSDIDVLSNHPYFYSRQTREVTML